MAVKDTLGVLLMTVQEPQVQVHQLDEAVQVNIFMLKPQVLQTRVLQKSQPRSLTLAH